MAGNRSVMVLRWSREDKWKFGDANELWNVNWHNREKNIKYSSGRVCTMREVWRCNRQCNHHSREKWKT